MRLLISATILILAFCWFVPNSSEGGGQPDSTLHLTDEADFTAAQERKIEIRRLNQELRSRAILGNLGEGIDKIDVDFFELKYGVRTDPEFEGLSERDIQDRIVELEKTEGGWETMTYNSSKLRDIYLIPPLTLFSETIPRVKDTDIIKMSNSVVAIIHKNYMKQQLDGTYALTTMPLLMIGGDALCSFSDFHNALFTKVAGTGFLIADTLIATAGHVYDNADDIINDYYFVFDYKMQTSWKVKTIYSDQDVYKAKKLVKRMNRYGNDWAVILLQRAVEGRDPLQYQTTGKVDNDASLYLIGHPFGLPMKYSGPGKVLNNIACYYFTCNLNNYEYNSGSPVIDKNTNLVAGILCRDLGPDEQMYCDCVAPAIFKSQFGIPGVQITRSYMFASYLESPDSVRIHCANGGATVRFEHHEEDPWFTLAADETLTVKYSDIYDLEVLISTDADCWVPFRPDPGDLWEIRGGPDESLTIVKVCE